MLRRRALAVPLVLSVSMSAEAPFARAAEPPPATAASAPRSPSAAPPSTPPPPPARRVRDALRGEALAAFDRASALFDEGDFAAARAELERAHALSGEPRVLYNVAVCDKALRRYARAVQRLEESLAEGGAKLPRSYVQKVNDTLALLRPLVTTLAITADEDGAAIAIDDEPAGTTPIAAPIPIEVGEHTVTARKSGFLDARAKLQATSGAPASVALHLEPLVARGELSVRASKLPAGVRGVAVVDGAEVGDVPWSGVVTAGLHAITVRAAGFTAPTVGESVAYKGRAEIDVDVRPVRHEGRLRVVAGDAADEIYVDGALVARGQYDGAVASGEHALRVARPGAKPSVSEIVVRDDETRTVSIQLASRGEIPTWIWIAGGVVVAGGATAAVLLLTSTTKFEGRAPGTLSPGVVSAGVPFRGL